MKITVIGRGNVGGGLAKRWRAAGHDVQELGRDGGDASDADAIVVAVPSGEISAALAKVVGIAGKVRSTRRTRSAAATTPSRRSRTR